jgi:hypothetical protein
VMVCAPGQAASMARSAMPGGTPQGTHRLSVIAALVQEYSQARWGWPDSPAGQRRAHQPDQVRPQRRPAGGRVILRRGEDLDAVPPPGRGW